MSVSRCWPWIVGLSCLLAGCMTHADRLRQVRGAFHDGDLPTAERLLAEALKKRDGDQDVLKLEQAMLRLAAGQPAEAEQLLREVRDQFDYLEQDSVSEKTLSMLADDQQRAYAGEDYEKVLLLAMLALSNLMHDAGDAEAYSLQVADKQQQLIEAALEPDGTNPKASYQQVALGPYLRATLREETHRDYDDAARQRAMVVSWQPGFRPGAADLERATHGRHSAPGHGVVYVFALVGRGPCKEEVAEEPSSAALLIADRILSATSSQTLPPTIAAIKVPRVVAAVNAVQHVGVSVNGQSAGQTETITDVSQMALSQFEATYPHLMARAVVRRVVKKGVVYGTKEALGVNKGSLESLPFDAAGVVWEAMERADTRCWGLLPEKIQVARLELPVGRHTLSCHALDRIARVIGPSQRIAVDVQDGRNTYVLVNYPGTRLVGRPLVSPSFAGPALHILQASPSVR